MTKPYRTTPFPYYWGPPTAAENWCEEDYIISPYIAEYVNTLTNIVYILLALRGLYRTYPSWQRSLPHLGLLVVGLGSSIYHASLREWPQLSDSLSMILATSSVLHRLLSSHPLHGKTLCTILWTFVASFSALHIKINNLNIHSIVFASMIIYIAYRVQKLIAMIKVIEQRRKFARKGWWGIGSAILGFSLWGLDSLICGRLRSLRRSVGLPWGMLGELHGWWHILTAVAAHLFMNLVDDLLINVGGGKCV